VFLNFTAPNIRVKDVEDTCRNVAGRNQPHNWIEDIKAPHPGTFTVRFQTVKDAHSLAGRLLTIRRNRQRPQRANARLYPSQSPKAYITNVKCGGPNAVREDAMLHSLASILPPANAVHLRMEEQPSGPNRDRRHWILVFRNCPRLLHFSVPIQKQNNSWTAVHFDPVSATDACTVCKTGHAIWDCGFFRSVTTGELGAPADDPRVLESMPRIA